MSEREGAYNVKDPDNERRNYGPMLLSLAGLEPEELFMQILVDVGPLYLIDMASGKPDTRQETAVADYIRDKCNGGLWPFAPIPDYVEWCLKLRDGFIHE